MKLLYEVFLSTRRARDCTTIQPIRIGNGIGDLTTVDIYDFIGTVVLNTVIILAVLGFLAVLGLYRTRREAVRGYNELAKGPLFRIDRYLYSAHWQDHLRSAEAEQLITFLGICFTLPLVYGPLEPVDGLPDVP